MVDQPSSAIACVIAALVAMAASGGPAWRKSNPKCDPLDPVSDAGWSVMPALETVGKTDSAPYQAGAIGDWFIDRTTRCCPFATTSMRSESTACAPTRCRGRSPRSRSQSARAHPAAATRRSRPMRAHARRSRAQSLYCAISFAKERHAPGLGKSAINRCAYNGIAAPRPNTSLHLRTDATFRVDCAQLRNRRSSPQGRIHAFGKASWRRVRGRDLGGRRHTGMGAGTSCHREPGSGHRPSGPGVCSIRDRAPC